MRRADTRLAGWVALVVALTSAGQLGRLCGQQDDRWAGPRTLPGLENVLRISDRLYAGGEPKGDAGFASLQTLGVRVVVSVDGARPDVERARRYGLRYVHIPIGYDGVPRAAQAALTRVVRELPGPIYIHCHHGQHRGPAAAAIAALACQAVDAAGARKILENAGTSPAYRGLWRDVEQFRPLPADAPLPELHEVAPVPTLAAAMAKLDRHFDLVKQLEKNRWQPLPDHPDVVAPQETLLLVEALHEARRRWLEQHNGDSGSDFARRLEEAENQAVALRNAVAKQQTTEASALVARLQNSCTDCHRRYRD
ncbi:MAG: hypothetical protein KatS3mg110_1572 [Pirellulaceae bacterium]|nr:MAG: hypothetical protein KatS3mg110_1572 [Pirellulaceae bacterium]